MSAAKAAWVRLVLNFEVPPEKAELQTSVAFAGASAEASGKSRGPAQPPTTEAAPPPGAPSGDTVGAFPVIPVIIGLAKTLTGELVANVSITNNTKLTLTLDNSSLKLASGAFKGKQPAHILKPGDPTSFVVHSTPIVDIPIPFLNSLIPDLSHPEGTIRYFVGDDKTVLSCFFINPRLITDPLGTNNAKVALAGPNAAGLQTSADATHGSTGTFTFSIDGKGGDTPVPPNGNDSAVAASCRVTVLNQTQQTLFLRKQDKAAGDYVTNPASSLAPGAHTDFVFAETPRSQDHGCRGLLSWDIGDPKVGTWDLMFDNPKGSKNLVAGFPKPDTFHSLEQIDQGDENVPVTFTLSGGPGGGGTTPGKEPTSCAIMVTNKTNLLLTLTGQEAPSGVFHKAPPKTLAAGASALVTFTGPPDDPAKGAKGAMHWKVGDTKTTWSLDWNNPPGAKNDSTSTLNPAIDGIDGIPTHDEGDDDVAFTFVLQGKGADPVIPPEEKDENFDAPPKGKQPTLRKGDKSPDGWVEYAQTLLNKYGAKLKVDGGFGNGTRAAVIDFQTKNHGQPDGVIGNETWSLLRKGPKENVGTDGRTPHTFEEKGAQARFVTEDARFAAYTERKDSFEIWVVSTGEQPIDTSKVTVKVIQPDGASHTHSVAIGPVKSPSPDGQGNAHLVEFKGFKQRFKIKDGIDVGTCDLDAYLDSAIGGDRWTGKIRVIR